MSASSIIAIMVEHLDGVSGTTRALCCAAVIAAAAIPGRAGAREPARRQAVCLSFAVPAGWKELKEKSSRLSAVDLVSSSTEKSGAPDRISILVMSAPGVRLSELLAQMARSSGSNAVPVPEWIGEVSAQRIEFDQLRDVYGAVVDVRTRVLLVELDRKLYTIKASYPTARAPKVGPIVERFFRGLALDGCPAPPK